MPYKVSTWDTIPAAAKDPEGYWTGDYYGVLSFAVNADLVKTPPADWADLLKPEFKSSVALAGDPRVSNQATMGVYAAGLASGATDAAKAANDGLKFYAELNKNGNFVPVIGKAASIAQGETPVLIFWDYNALAARDTLKGNPKVDVIVPKSGVVAGVYVQAISAYAPHPNAAKLWLEHLYSDEGQMTWLKGYCHPIRFTNLVAAGKVPAGLLAALPPAAGYAKAKFPTLDEQKAAGPCRSSRRLDWAAWVGVAPFFVFAAMFLILPTAGLLVGAFQDRGGAVTLANFWRLGQPSIRLSYRLSLEVSAASAALGAIFGLGLALAALCGGLPRWLGAPDADDLQRRRLQLRRRAARLRLHGDAGPPRARHRASCAISVSTSMRRASAS